MLKKIFVNVILIIIIVFSFDLYFYFKAWNGTSFLDWANNVFFTIPVEEYFDNLWAGKYSDTKEKIAVKQFRPDENTNFKNQSLPILYMGCSFTYGYGLEENETISYKTARLTNRPVYNRGGWAWGLDQLVYQLRREDLMTTIPEPEFLIYTFIPDQLARLDKYKIEPQFKEFQPHFKIINNSLKELKPNLFDHLIFVEHLLYYKYYALGNTNDEKQKRIKLYFNEAYNAMRKYWRNTKFVILLYPQNANDYNDLSLSCWKDLEKDFTVIDVNKLTNKKMEEYKCSHDNWHPSAEAWIIILPKLFDYLKIDFNK